MAKKHENILVFCAHSDDQILGPGATLAKYAKEKKHVHTIILSYGISALPWMKEGFARQTRIKEANNADKVIGGRGVRFFNLIEGKFRDSCRETNADMRIIEILEKMNPSKVFVHTFEDPHPDHRETYRILVDCINKAGIKPDIFLFDIWNPFNLRKSHLPKMYVDVSDSFDTKIKALKCFPSQWSSMMALTWSVYFKAITNGFYIHTKYAERFFKVK